MLNRLFVLTPSCEAANMTVMSLLLLELASVASGHSHNNHTHKSNKDISEMDVSVMSCTVCVWLFVCFWAVVCVSLEGKDTDCVLFFKPVQAGKINAYVLAPVRRRANRHRH